MSITIGTETITRNPSHPVDWYTIRYNQYKQETADGGWVVYDNGPSVIYGTIILKLVDRTEGNDLRTYLEDTAIMGKNSFTVTPPSITDLGKGNNTAIQVYYNGGNSLKGVFTLVAPNYYDIRLPYREDLDGVP